MKRKHAKAVTAHKKSAPVVSQEILEEYRTLCELCRRKNKVRKKIVSMLESGAQVEPGALFAVLKIMEQARASWPKLQAVLGEDRVASLRARIEPTEVRVLRVSRKGESASTGWE